MYAIRSYYGKDGKLKGLITIKDIDNIEEFPNACKDSQGRLRVGAAVSVGNDTIERVAALVKAGADVITVDSAHGHVITSYSIHYTKLYDSRIFCYSL